MKKVFNLDEPYVEIIILIITAICLVWALILGQVNLKTNNNAVDIEVLDVKYDSILYYLKGDYNKLKVTDSLNKEFRNKAFYIDKDSVDIDTRGYFRSRYHKRYKIKK